MQTLVILGVYLTHLHIYIKLYLEYNPELSKNENRSSSMPSVQPYL